MTELEQKINSILPTQIDHVFYKTKRLELLESKTLKTFKQAIKKYVNAPKTNKILYTIRIKINPESDKRKIIILCSEYIVDIKLNIKIGKVITVVYSDSELKKYNFKLTHIKKIINALKKDSVNYDDDFINIGDILK